GTAGGEDQCAGQEVVGRGRPPSTAARRPTCLCTAHGRPNASDCLLASARTGLPSRDAHATLYEDRRQIVRSFHKLRCRHHPVLAPGRRPMTSAPAGCDATPDAKVRPPFGVGVNLPWRRYGCDFGTNAWRLGGLTGHDMSPVRRALAAAAEAGARVVRWFVLCDGRAGIDFSPAGWPLRLQPAVLDDMGRAIALAGEAGLQLVPVLFDFHLGRPATQVRGVQLGGRHALIRDPVARQAFVAACVDPLVRAFGRDARIACWDLCNEP